MSEADPRIPGPKQTKKLIVAIGGFAALVAIVAAAIALSPPTPRVEEIEVMADAVEEVPTRVRYQGSMDDLLPTRGDIGTEWIFSAPPNGFDGDAAFDHSQFYVHDSRFQVYNSPAGKEVLVSVFNFDIGTAESAYREKISTIYEVGGFLELPTENIDATCYGVGTVIQSWTSLEYFCFEKNIVFHVKYGVHGFVETQDIEEAANFADSVAWRIE